MLIRHDYREDQVHVCGLPSTRKCLKLDVGPDAILDTEEIRVHTEPPILVAKISVATGPAIGDAGLSCGRNKQAANCSIGRSGVHSVRANNESAETGYREG